MSMKMRKIIEVKRVVRLTPEERMLLKRGGAQTTRKGGRGYNRQRNKLIRKED